MYAAENPSATHILRGSVLANQDGSEFQSSLHNAADIQETELSVLPDVPLPPTPEPSLEELLAAGHSVVSELGLFSWWAPPGYFRYALEYMHVHWDLPWWVTIIGGIRCFS